MPIPHRYKIVPKNPEAHLFEVTVTVAEPDTAGQQFMIPAWIPGSYLIRDFAKHVVEIRAASEGQEIGLTKTDKSSWLADPCDGPLVLTAEIYAYDLSVRGAHLDATHAYFNGPSVFPAVVGQEDRPCEVDIAPPPAPLGNDWRVATSMRAKTAERYGYGIYEVGDYAELIDHPVEIGVLQIGEFEAAGIPHAIAVRGHARVDVGRICRDLATLCTQHHQLLSAPADLDRYLFLLLVLGQGYGGLEHRWSSSLVCSRHELPRRGETTVSDGYRKFLGLCSHEYFHLWNVTRMKPAVFTPYDLQSESHTGLLWVFEGITSYYDDLALVRSGLITTESYLELLAQTITRVLRTQGRFRQSVEESSYDAWTRFYKQDAGSPNFIVSYYTKGSLLACALDLTLRRLTGGECSLDDVLRECWRRYGESGIGVPERGLESVAKELCGVDIDDFFERYVRGTAELPLEQLLKDCGIQLRLRAARNGNDAGGKPAAAHDPLPPWLGATLTASGDRSVFQTVHAGSPAERAGVAPGDEAAALDDLKLSARNMRIRLGEYRAGDEVSLAVFRRDELLRLKVTLEDPPEDTCYLLVDADASDAQLKIRESWLSG